MLLFTGFLDRKRARGASNKIWASNIPLYSLCHLERRLPSGASEYLLTWARMPSFDLEGYSAWHGSDRLTWYYWGFKLQITAESCIQNINVCCLVFRLLALGLWQRVLDGLSHRLSWFHFGFHPGKALASFSFQRLWSCSYPQGLKLVLDFSLCKPWAWWGIQRPMLRSITEKWCILNQPIKRSTISSFISSMSSWWMETEKPMKWREP